jgi:hypothetical protein
VDDAEFDSAVLALDARTAKARQAACDAHLDDLIREYREPLPSLPVSFARYIARPHPTALPMDQTPSILV